MATDNEQDIALRLQVYDDELVKMRGAQETLKRFNSEAVHGFKETEQRARAANKEINGIGKDVAVGRFKELATSLTGVSIGMTGIIMAAQEAARAYGSAVQAAGEYQARILEISTLSDMSGSALKSMSSDLQDLSVQFGQVDTVMAKAQYDVMSSGFTNAADSLHILEVASRSAIGGVTNVATSAKLLTQILNAYGMTAADAGDVSDILFATVRDGVTTFEELAQNLGNVTATAATAKIDLVEVAAAIAVMTKKGIGTPEAVTALNQLIVNIGAASGESKKKLDELGITLDNGLAPALKAINESGGASLDVLRALVPDVRALKGAAAAGADGARELRQEIEIISHSAGAADTAYNKMADGMVHQADRLTAANDRLKQSFGSLFAPERATLANNLATAVNNFTKDNESAAGTIKRMSEINQLAHDPLMALVIGFNRLGREVKEVGYSMQYNGVFTDEYAANMRRLRDAAYHFRITKAAVDELTDAEKNAAEAAARLAELAPMAAQLGVSIKEIGVSATGAMITVDRSPEDVMNEIRGIYQQATNSARLGALAPTAQILGIDIKEIAVSATGAQITVDRSPEAVMSDIRARYQRNAELAKQPMIPVQGATDQRQGPWAELSRSDILLKLSEEQRDFGNEGVRSLTMVESGVLSLGSAITGSLSNALSDSKAKLLDLGQIGASVFGTIIGGLVNMGIGYLFPALKPVLGLGKKSALGGPAFGPTLVGEYGPEMIWAPRGSQVLPSDKTAKALSGGGDTVHIDARTTVVLPRGSVITLDSASSVRKLAETITRTQETKIARTYRPRRRSVA